MPFEFLVLPDVK